MAKPPPKSKLYTRIGDGGETALFGGRRVSKDHPRVAAYGTIDELNSALGLAVSFIRQKRVIDELHKIQNELFNIGAELATDPSATRSKKASSTFELSPDKTQWIEQLIDEYDSRVPPLRTFILPSGPPGATSLHLARTICRRAEREVVSLARAETVNPAVLAYLNRLCDLLFVLARYLNKAARRRELTWEHNW